MVNDNSNSMIDYSVVIDFDVPEGIKAMMEECESLNKIDSPAYYNYSETLGYMCKELVVVGKMTQKQWDVIERRYEPGW